MAPRLSLHVRAKIVNYKYTLRLNHSAIARKLCSEGTKVSRRAVYSILKRYRETKSFRDAYRKPVSFFLDNERAKCMKNNFFFLSEDEC